MTTQALIPLRLVIIEDNADDAELATLSFQGSDFEIVRRLCVQSVSAMRAAMVREPFDAVICVCMKSGFDISEAFAEAAKVGPALPFIVVSEAAGTSPAQARPLEGAVNEVPKNHLARLPEVVRRTRHAGLSPELPAAASPDLAAAPPDLTPAPPDLAPASPEPTAGSRPTRPSVRAEPPPEAPATGQPLGCVARPLEAGPGDSSGPRSPHLRAAGPARDSLRPPLRRR